MTTFAIIRTMIVGILAWLVLDKTIYLADHDFLVDGIIYLLIIADSIIFYIIIIFKDRKEFKKTRNWANCLPSCAGLVAIAGIFLTKHTLAQRDESPTILFASLPSDFNGLSIDFRADSTYKLTDWCLGTDTYRGKYRMQDSTIIIDRSPLGKRRGILTDSLIIHRNDSTIILDNRMGTAIENTFYIRCM